MKAELKDILWLESSIRNFAWKDVECDGARGPIKEMRILREPKGSLLTITLDWFAVYRINKWVRAGGRMIIQFLNPKIELLDDKKVRISTTGGDSVEFCVIFFGYPNIVPTEN